MKKIILLSVLLIIAFALLAQIPQAFKYQTVVRGISGDVLPNQFISLQISIHDGSAGGTIVYQETHDVTTNQFGLANLEIGLGLPIIGDFISIDWQTGLKFMEIALDPTGGNTYVSMGTSQLFSVPYALYDGDWTISGNDLYTSLPGNVGIGTTSPQATLDVNGSINSLNNYLIEGNSVISVEGLRNLLVGIGAGENNTGTWVTCIGDSTGYNNQGESNTFVGSNAGADNTSGHYNTFVGTNAGNQNIGGNVNTFIGKESGSNNTSGYYNTYLGGHAGRLNETGKWNTCIGIDAGANTQDGIANTFLGSYCGRNSSVGDSNVFIGFLAGELETGSNKLIIANGPYDNNILIYGEFVSGNLGIGTISPQATLDVNGSINSLNNYLIDGNSVISVEGERNLLVGVGAGEYNTGTWATFIGDSAGFNNQGIANLFLGTMAGFKNTTGGYNTFVGPLAGQVNTLGGYNTFVGTRAGHNNIGGNWNTFIGYDAGTDNTSGYYNTYLGGSAGSSNETGKWNTCIGVDAGANTQDANANTFLGSYCGRNSSVGDSNVFIGFFAGELETGSNKLIIANGANDNNILMYGDFVSGNLGFGTKELNHKLNINGNAVFTGEDGWDDPGDQAGLFLGDPNHGIKASFDEGLRLWTFDDPNHAIRFQNQTGTDYMTIKMGTGNVGIGTTDPEFKLSLDNDGGILAKGTFGNGDILGTTGAGTRLIWYPRKAAFRAGYAWDDDWNDINIGNSSIAMGSGAKASGDYSTAMGYKTISSGNTSIAIGGLTEASGDISIAMGSFTKAESYNSMAIGNFNIGGGDPINWIEDDPLFEIGNGGGSTLSNALTVLKNGNTGIGTHTPQSLLHINQDETYLGIRLEYISTAYWDTYVDAAQDYNFAYNGTLRGYINDSDGSYNAMSDKKLKKEITSLPKILGKVNQLKPCTYRFKDDNSGGKKSIGLIAQEVEPLFPEVVHEKDGLKGINYSAFAVIAIQAIKEQQEIIDKQQSQIDELKDMVSKLVK